MGKTSYKQQNDNNSKTLFAVGPTFRTQLSLLNNIKC